MSKPVHEVHNCLRPDEPFPSIQQPQAWLQGPVVDPEAVLSQTFKLPLAAVFKLFEEPRVFE